MNDWGSALGVCNGTRALVHEVDPALGLVTLQLVGGPVRRVDLRYASESLEHGYALTGHAAQGLTVEQAFVLVRAEGALAEWGYVAASRARGETRLYAVRPELEADDRLAGERPDASRALRHTLARPAAMPSAVELSEHSPGPPAPWRIRRESLERQIGSRERLLASFESELADLGWLGRRRHGERLRNAIGVQHRVLDDLRADLAAELMKPARAIATPTGRERPREPRSVERALRPPLERGIGLER